METSYNVEDVQTICVGDFLHIDGEDYHQSGWCLTLPLVYHLRVELNQGLPLIYGGKPSCGTVLVEGPRGKGPSSL